MEGRILLHFQGGPLEGKGNFQNEEGGWDFFVPLADLGFPPPDRVVVLDLVKSELESLDPGPLQVPVGITDADSDLPVEATHLICASYARVHFKEGPDGRQATYEHELDWSGDSE